ncbi:MAG: 4-hydroxy-tetrahydrodipicolinate reductase [bacterium]
MSVNTALRIAVSGADGRMGREVRRLVEAAPDLTVAAALERADHPEAGSTFEADTAAGLARADVLIDFTLGAVAPALFRAAARAGTAVVSGTTGLDDAGELALADAAQRIPVVWAPNMSLGVNLLLAVAEQVAAALPASYEAELVELHHRHKRDAPSGTALGLLRAIRAARPAGADVFGRHGDQKPRAEDEVGVHAVRGGEVVGEHRLYFLGEYERLELCHIAQSRAAFAQGAVQAARWVVGRPPGRYHMRHVLGLE